MSMSTKLIGIGVLLAGCSWMYGQSDISAERIKAHVRFLSSDLLEGRGVGSRGGKIAEEYLAATLAGYGVRPAGENGTFFQTVPMKGVVIDPAATSVSAVRGKTNLTLK